MQKQCCLTRRFVPDKIWLALAVGILMYMGCSLSLSAQAQERFLQFEAGTPEEIRVDQGKFVNARTSSKVSRVVVGDPDIATAVPLTDTTLYVLGKANGRTNVAVYGANDRLLGSVNVEVGADVPDLEASLHQALPKAKIRVETINGRLRLSGTVPDGISLQKALEVAKQYSSAPVINALNVAGGQQVLLEVRFIEANRNAGREIGVSWFGRRANDSNSRRGIITGGYSHDEEKGIVFNPNLASGSTPFGTIIAEVLGGGIKADILVQALEEKGLARRLAEPNLTALSGERASFLAGGEVPIPVAEEDGKVTVDYKEYGVRLNFTPTVLDNGLINLKLEPEVSQVDGSVAVRAGLIEIPAFITRRASTTIEVRDGQSFAMAGLLQSAHTKSQDQIPWLGQLPVLGTLFRSSSFQEEETDLVIIVTPRLVRPAKPGQPLRTPLDATKPSNDAEFFLLGQMEVSRNMQRRFAEGAGIAGPSGHIIDLKSEQKNVSKKIVKH